MIDQLKKTAVNEFRKGNRQKAVIMIREFLNQNPDAKELYPILGYMAFQVDDRKTAEVALEHAIGLPECDKNSFIMLCVLQSMTDSQKALETALLGIKSHPHCAELYNLAGMYQTAGGSPEDGKTLFQKAVSLEPEDTEYRYNLAVCKIHLKEYEDALTLLHSMHDKNPIPSGYFLHVALCHDNLGHFNRAAELYEKLVSENQDGIAALNLARMFRRTSRDPVVTSDLYRRALELQELSITVAEEYADVLLESGRYEELLTFIEKARAGMMASPLLDRILADGLSRMGDTQSAERHLVQLIEQDKNDWVSMNQLAIICKEDGRLKDALAWIKMAAILNPSHPEILYNLANLLHGNAPEPEVIQVYHQILEIEPRHTKALNDLGMIWLNKDEYRKAEECFKRALAITSTMPELLNNYGMYLYQTRQYEFAERILKRAIQLQSDSPELHKNLSMILLVQGKLEEGFFHYEWRLKKEQRLPYKIPADKADFAGSKVLVYHEQGLGDTIQFIRYVKTLVEIGAEVIVELPLELHPLFQNVSWISKLLKKSETPDVISQCDYIIPVMSLPGFFTKELADITDAGKYLIPDSETANKWNKMTAVKNLKIGFVWGGNKKQVNDFRRSLPPELLTPLMRIPDTSWFCLQMNRDDEYDATFSSLKNTVPSHRYIKDFSDTASLISQLDIVVSVCTSVAHLSGALGKHTVLLLAYAADWRWFSDRTDSPYYQNMVLFRQHAPGEWGSVIRQVKKYLTEVQARS